MLLVSANVNGIRAAVRRGGLAWLEAAAPDVVTLQEVRASDAGMRAALASSAFEGWHVAHSACTTKGRAGVAVLSRTAPAAVRESLGRTAGHEFVGAGRWVEANVVVGESVVTVASAYVHTGEAGTPRQDEKMRFLEAIGERLTGWAADGRYAVLTGDLNIAHTVDDLKNWKGNRGKAGFLPAEQAVLDGWFAGLGYVDVHRRLHGPGPGRTRGGRGGGRRSTTTLGGASTTTWHRRRWVHGRYGRRWGEPRPTPSGGATTPR